MKPNHLFTSLLAATALFVASCSSTRMTQNTALQDDVFNSSVKAKEFIAMTPSLQNLKVDSIGGEAYYAKSNPYYDMDYTSRIDRFYYGSAWRSYFDSYSDFYGYYAYRPYSFGARYGGFYGDYNTAFVGNYLNYWSFYGAPYYNNFWGPFSFSNPYYGNYYGNSWGWGGYYGGGFGGGGYVVRNNNNNPRPNRGTDNGIVRANGSYIGAPSRSDNNNNGTNSNIPVRSRAEMYNPTNGNTATRPTSSDSRPSRGSETQSRPSRGNDSPPPSRPTYTPPPTQSAPPPSSSGSSSRGGGGGGGGGRPTRGGR